MPTPPDLPTPANAALVTIAGPAATLTKAQRAFNRQVQRIVELRTHLALWQAAETACHQRAAAELRPLQARLATLQRETVLWIDAHLARGPQGERLPRKLQAKLPAMLCLLAQAVLQAGPDAEVEAAFDRHSSQSHRDAQREQADLAAAVLGQVMGDASLFDGDAESVDALMQRAGERMRARAEDGSHDGADEGADGSDGTGPSEPLAEPTPKPGHRPSREAKARARDAQALQQASQSVREVYRRLASSLHPDRETDPAERQRKTTLMARVNDAYARRDLLALLTVQIDIEQIDASHLAGISDERLRHYTRVLKDQQQALDDELAAFQMPVADHLGAPPAGLAWPARMLGQVLDDDIDSVRSALAHLAHDSERLRDGRTRLAFLRALDLPDDDDGIDALDALMLLQALGDGDGPPQRKARRRR